MRIAFFSGGAGPVPLQALRAVAREHEIAVVVRPALHPNDGRRPLRALLRPVARRLGLAAPDPVADIARAHRAPLVTAHGRGDSGLAPRIERARADAICIAGYPWLLPRSVLALARLGAVNLHPSLLPRHRGLLPLFWIYWHDDRETGVTAHLATGRADAGPVLVAERFPLARGLPVDRLNEENGRRGGGVLVEALAQLERGARGTPQETALATRAPLVEPGRSMIRFDEWDVERVWHFCAGLAGRFEEPLTDHGARPVRYDTVTRYERARHGRAPGGVERRKDGLRLYCLGGHVSLAWSADDALGRAKRA